MTAIAYQPNFNDFAGKSKKYWTREAKKARSQRDAAVEIRNIALQILFNKGIISQKDLPQIVDSATAKLIVNKQFLDYDYEEDPALISYVDRRVMGFNDFGEFGFFKKLWKGAKKIGKVVVKPYTWVGGKLLKGGKSLGKGAAFLAKKGGKFVKKNAGTLATVGLIAATGGAAAPLALPGLLPGIMPGAGQPGMMPGMQPQFAPTPSGMAVQQLPQQQISQVQQLPQQQVYSQTQEELIFGLPKNQVLIGGGILLIGGYLALRN
jgi:hypothetical protein